MAELSMLVKATVILILALVAAWLGSRQSASVRSLMLACAFGLLLLLPVASLMLPVRAIELPASVLAAVRTRAIHDCGTGRRFASRC